MAALDHERNTRSPCVGSIAAFVIDQKRQKRFQAAEAMEKANALRIKILADPEAAIKRIHCLRALTRADAILILALLLGCIWGAAEIRSVVTLLSLFIVGLELSRKVQS